MKNKEDNEYLEAKLLDKIKEVNIKKIVNTNFFDGYEQKTIIRFLRKVKFKNHVLFGGYKDSERKIIVFYSENLTEEIVEKSSNNFLIVLRIEVPNEQKGKYFHKDYLGALMKIGVKREVIGDILVDATGADIIILESISEYILGEIQKMKRFSKSKFSLLKLKDLREKQELKIEKKIIVSSLRLDSIISELINISRSKANELINSERVFINFENFTNNSKLINVGDLITIRGKGRFHIDQLVGNTKKGNLVLKTYIYK